MRKRRGYNNNFDFAENSPGAPDVSSKVRLSPYWLRRDRIGDCLNEKTRVAITLHCLCGWPAGSSYAVAFNFKGSYKSLAPLASRFFNHPEIREMCELFVRLYDGTPYHTHEKYYR